MDLAVVLALSTARALYLLFTAAVGLLFAADSMLFLSLSISMRDSVALALVTHVPSSLASAIVFLLNTTYTAGIQLSFCLVETAGISVALALRLGLAPADWLNSSTGVLLLLHHPSAVLLMPCH